MGCGNEARPAFAVALSNADLVASFRAALPDWRPSDVVGSPTASRTTSWTTTSVVRRAWRPRARHSLRGGSVFSSTSCPTTWRPITRGQQARPEIFVLGTDEQLENDPASFLRVAGRVLARGRDPYFPAWPDVVQLNAFAPELRSLMVETLIGIADQCDGVRCDMAMLVMNDVFARTWGEAVGPEPAASTGRP